MSDPVNHPPHYTSHPSGVECIDITEHYGFSIGNTIKYLERQVLRLASSFCYTYATTVGFGRPVAQAAKRLNMAVERLEAAYASQRNAQQQGEDRGS